MLRSTRALMLCGLFVSTPLLALDYRIETFSEGLENPWAVAFLPDGRMLVTERVGRLRMIEADGSVDPKPVAGLPEVFIAAQAGLMEVALGPGLQRQPLALPDLRARLAGGQQHASGACPPGG